MQVDSSSLLCDCNLRWFAQWVNSSAVRGVAASCAHPEALKDRAVTSVAAEMFTCEDFPKPYILVEPRSQIALRGKVSCYTGYECCVTPHLAGPGPVLPGGQHLARPHDLRLEEGWGDSGVRRLWRRRQLHRGE